MILVKKNIIIFLLCITCFNAHSLDNLDIKLKVESQIEESNPFFRLRGSYSFSQITDYVKNNDTLTVYITQTKGIVPPPYWEISNSDRGLNDNSTDKFILTSIPLRVVSKPNTVKYPDRYSKKGRYQIKNKENKIIWDNSNNPSYWEINKFNQLKLVSSPKGVQLKSWIFNLNDFTNEFQFIIGENNHKNVAKFKGNLFGESLKFKTQMWMHDFLQTNTASKSIINVFIKQYVEKRIQDWQLKGEYEKTSNYKIRVNEDSRRKKVSVLQNSAIKKIKQFYIDFLEDSYKNIKYLNSSLYELGKYDPDNETFLIDFKSPKNVQQLVVSVPIEIAPEIKNNFQEVIMHNHQFNIVNGDMVLTYLDLSFQGKTYPYDVKNQYTYANTEIDYNFDPILIELNDNALVNNSAKIKTNKISVGKSDIDINIPTNAKLSNRYALVIGNEDYKSMQKTLSSEQNVDYAANDAEIFKEYALKTLGVPDENMHFLLNATSGQMYQEIDLITKIVGKIGTKAELIVYYAGHGFPDEQTKAPYLIPVDVAASNLSSAIKLDDFYTKLSSTNASKVTVFLDACFTGDGRNQSLVSSRGVKVVAKQGSLNGNLVVFSASSGKQSSLPYHKERHGMFTYHLLKKLKDTKGSITFGELYSYLEEKVSLESLKVNKMEQDPKINVSNQVKSQWLNWKF